MLTREQAQYNQKKYGWNELIEKKEKNIFQLYLEQFKDFLVVILIIAAVIVGILGDIESTLVICLVITMNAVLGTIQTLKAEQSLKSLRQLSAPEAKVIRDGKMIKIPAKEITIGDEVIVEAGDLVPADGRLLEVVGLKVDESALTGESIPVEKTIEKILEKTSEKAIDNVAVGEQPGRVFSGSFVTYGHGRFEVTSIGMNTEVGKIADLIKNASEKKTPLQKNLDDFGKKLSILIIGLCGLLFLLSMLRGDNILNAFLFAIALAVAAIPEALSSIVTIVLSFGTQKMAKEHAIVRKLQAVEALGSVSIICSDKTGTLTQNKMMMEDYYIYDKRIPVTDISDDHHQPEFASFLEELQCVSVLCNDALFAEEKEIGDPTEIALLRVPNKGKDYYLDMRRKYPRLSELPFDSDRKLMSTEHKINEKYIVCVKGAVDVILKRVTHIKKSDENELVVISEEEKKKIEKQNMEFSREGLRVLAFAYKELDKEKVLCMEDEQQLVFLGMIAMMDPPREETRQAVTECIQAGIRPIMITGDHKVTAMAIAKRIGILKQEEEACEGAVIDSMTEEELEEFVENISVYARVSPEHKIRIVRAWQNRGNVVAMTGDGVNDAPALKQADVGVAMGITGSEVAKDAAAMVLTDDNFATIVKAVENGRNLYQNIKNAIQFLLAGNFAAILTVLFASIVDLPVPFAPVHLLFINLLTDSLPAIALGLESHTKNVMNESPRSVNESILTGRFIADIGIEGLVIAAITIAGYLIGYHNGGAVLASTMAFGTLCMSRLMHGFNCKSRKTVIFTKKFFNNRYLLAAFGIGMFLISGVLTVSKLQNVFQIVTLDGQILFIVYGLASLALLVIQLLKGIRNNEMDA